MHRGGRPGHVFVRRGTARSCPHRVNLVGAHGRIASWPTSCCRTFVQINWPEIRMPTVLPSHIVEAIDAMFGPDRNEADVRMVQVTHKGKVHALLAMLDAVAPELIDLNATDYRELSECRGVLATTLPAWSVGDLMPAVQVGGRDVVACIRRLMKQCRDHVPPPEPELPFIKEDDVRLGLEDRIQAAWTDFRANEWMGSTVLAAHTLEALLLWAVKKKIGSTPSSRSPDRMVLNELIDQAAKINLITSDGKRQADLARDARNLIHPGKATRSGSACSKATALTALAAVYRVADDLKSST